MYKIGDVRSDGMVFRGYRKGASGQLEHWVSAEAFARRREKINAHRRKNAALSLAVPGARTAYNIKMAEYMRDARRARPEVHMLARVRARAKAKGLVFDITVADISIPKRCPILGIPLVVGDGTATDNSPELDRINNSRGYVRGNIHVISRRANRIKNDATLTELEKIASYLRTLKSGKRQAQTP
jgi:hypothetical protein